MPGCCLAGRPAFALPNFSAPTGKPPGAAQASGAPRQFAKVLVAVAVAVIAGLTLLAFKGHDPVRVVDPPKVHHPAVHHPHVVGPRTGTGGLY